MADGNGAESYQELVVDRSSVLEEQYDNLLNAAFTWGELGLSTIGDWQAFVRREMGFGWMGMFKLDEKVLDVASHTDATLASCIVPFDVNT